MCVCFTDQLAASLEGPAFGGTTHAPRAGGRFSPDPGGNCVVELLQPFFNLWIPWVATSCYISFHDFHVAFEPHPMLGIVESTVDNVDMTL